MSLSLRPLPAPLRGTWAIVKLFTSIVLTFDMFKPTIRVYAPKDTHQALQEAFTATSPRECSSNFGGDQQKTLVFLPQYDWTEVGQVDLAASTPHVILYMFVCAGKNGYFSGERKKLLEFYNKFHSRTCPVIPIFINDPKVKEKSIFSQTSSVLTLLQSDIPSGQMINFLKGNIAKRADMPKVWQAIVTEILNGVTNKIKDLNKKLEGDDLAVTFRTSMDLILVYDSVGLYTQVESMVEKALELIDSSHEYFKSFLSPKSLKLEIEVAQLDDTFDRTILARPDPSEFDMRFVLAMYTIHVHMGERHPDLAIATALRWIREVEWRVKENADPLDYRFWLAHSLYKLLSVCEREKEAGREDTKKLYEQILEWYIITLSATRREWKSQDKSANTDDGVDPLQSPSDLPPQAQTWPDMFNLVTTKVKFEEEMLRLLNAQFDFAYSQGHGKTAAYVARRLLECAPDTRNLRKVSALAYARGKMAHLLGPQILQDIQELSIQDQIRCLGYVLWDKKVTFKKEVCDRINELTDSPGFQEIKMVAHIPFAVQIVSNNRYIEGEPNTISFMIKCPFEGELTCRQFRVGLTSRIGLQNPNREFIVSDDNLVLKNGEVVTCKGKFLHKCPHWPTYVRLWKGKGVIHIPLPPSFTWIDVGSMPKPITMSVEMPRYMLPRCWQIALLKLDVLRPLASLDFKVSGLAFKPAALRGKDKVVVEPTTGFSFAEVGDGSYEVYLQIKPDKSGSLKIEAVASGQEIIHEVPFTVSDFLRMKAVYKSATKIAQLSVSLESASDIVLTDVKFYNGDNEEIGSESIGLPVALKLTNSFVMSILESEPDYAVTFLQQKGLEPFSLRLNVEKIRQDEVVALQPITPMTILLPNDFGI